MDSHHGKIWLTSEEGEGTPAFLYLPAPERRGVAVMKILIIEDDQSVAELGRITLEINGGFQCDLYTDGTQGLQAALAGTMPWSLWM